MRLLLPAVSGVALLALTAAGCSASVEVGAEDDATTTTDAVAGSYADFFTATAGPALEAIRSTGAESSDPEVLNAAVTFDTDRYAFAAPSTDDGAWCVESLEGDPVRSMTAASEGDRFGLFFNDVACGDVVPEDSPVALEISDGDALVLTLLKGEDDDLQAAADAFSAQTNEALGLDEGQTGTETGVEEGAETVANAMETYAADIGAYPADQAEADSALEAYGIDVAALYTYDADTDTYVVCVDDGAQFAIYDSAAGAITAADAGTC